MSLNLITGHYGVEHITSDDAGHYNSHVISKEKLLLSEANLTNVAVSKSGTTSFTFSLNCELSALDGIINGRYFRKTSSDLIFDSISDVILNNPYIIWTIYAEYHKDHTNTLEDIFIYVMHSDATNTAPSREDIQNTLPTYANKNVLDGDEDVDFVLFHILSYGTEIKNIYKEATEFTGSTIQDVKVIADGNAGDIVNLQNHVGNVDITSLSSENVVTDALMALYNNKLGTANISALGTTTNNAILYLNNNKQDNLNAGYGISISGTTISVDLDSIDDYQF